MLMLLDWEPFLSVSVSLSVCLPLYIFIHRLPTHTRTHRKAHSPPPCTPWALELEQWYSWELTCREAAVIQSSTGDEQMRENIFLWSSFQFRHSAVNLTSKRQAWIFILLCINSFSFGNEVQVYLFPLQRDIPWKAAWFLIRSPITKGSVESISPQVSKQWWNTGFH